MADNTRGGSESGTAPLIASDEVTYSGETADVQLLRAVHVTGAEGSRTVVEITTADGIFVSGAVAHGSPDTGLPLKIGGKAQDNAPSEVDDNDRINAWFDLRGSLHVVNTGTNGEEPTISSVSDGDGETLATIWAAARGQVYNGATWDRMRSAATDAQAAIGIPAAGNMLWNGATWDRFPGTIANGIDVDVTRLPALVAGTANIGDVDVLTLPTLPAGTNNIGDVDVITMPNVTLAAGTNTNEVVGDAAHDAAAAGNPILTGLTASTVVPTGVGADGRVVRAWSNRSGAQIVVDPPHVGLNSDPWNLVHEGAQYTSAQTSTVLVTGGASEKIVVTNIQIQAFATTAGTAVLYFGTGAFSRGTNRAIFDGEFAPSATLKPGVVMDGPFIAGTNGDDLMVTTTNALSITFNVWYYVVT